MSVLQEYKCPSCGGSLEFNSKIQKMKCPYCDTEFEPEAFKELDEALSEEAVKDDSFSWTDTEKSDWTKEDGENIRAYVCNSCGGEIITDDTTAATSCPYCNNPVVMKEQLQGLLKPDFVIPFKLDKKQAMEAYKKHISGKKLLPAVFKEKNHIDEIKGIYVPFWLYDAAVQGSAQYKATNVRHWSDTNYNYTETRHYSVFRGGNMAFSKIPVDGSTKMADDLMESIEPFDFSEAVDFGTAYLSGYFADKYDVSMEDSIIRANERIKKSTVDALSSTVTGYTSVMPTGSNINMLSGSSKYALYPVWLLNTTFNGQKYTFAMNGQTGKFVGDLPMDKSKYMKYFGISTAIGTAAGFIATILFNLFFG
ncbi:MAG: hypothetical protein IKL10_03035 [Clostridia bacterium]|nr:hypothetical protein [Clostridia bacterium]